MELLALLLREYPFQFLELSQLTLLGTYALLDTFDLGFSAQPLEFLLQLHHHLVVFHHVSVSFVSRPARTCNIIQFRCITAIVAAPVTHDRLTAGYCIHDLVSNNPLPDLSHCPSPIHLGDRIGPQSYVSFGPKCKVGRLDANRCVTVE